MAYAFNQMSADHRRRSGTDESTDGDGNGLSLLRGASSFFRGVSRYIRHEQRLLGWRGVGQQVQAATVEHMLLGEALGLALHANQQVIAEGYGVLGQNKGLLIGRQGAGMLSGLALGGTAGPSLGFVAGMGDVYHNIEMVASEFQIYVTTVDANQPILPQLPANVRSNVAGRLEGIGNTLLLGK